MDIKLTAAVAGAVRPGEVAAFCRAQDISRETFYKWRRRFEAEGRAGLVELSRRPHRSPGASPAAVEERVVWWRKRLLEDGLDAGPATIAWHLQQDGATPPSESTIWRILTRRGQVVPQPRKRPKASLHRFVYDRPNECWQADATDWALADGTRVQIINVLDDCSRFLLASLAVLGVADAADVWTAYRSAILGHGVPQRMLTDNGLIFSGRRRGWEVVGEANLRTLGCQPICSSVHHPQTCGKVERFQQTLKKWLRTQPPARTLAELRRQLTTFRELYNEHRPHKSIRRRTPGEVYRSLAKAAPTGPPIEGPRSQHRVRVNRIGNVALGRFVIKVGVAHAGATLDLIRQGDHVVVFEGDQILRTLTLDHTKRYQPSGRGYHHGPPMPPPDVSAMS